MYVIEVKWQGKSRYNFYTVTNSLSKAKFLAEDLYDSSHGSNMKEYRILNEEGEVVYHSSKIT